MAMLESRIDEWTASFELAAEQIKLTQTPLDTLAIWRLHTARSTLGYGEMPALRCGSRVLWSLALQSEASFRNELKKE